MPFGPFCHRVNAESPSQSVTAGHWRLEDGADSRISTGKRPSIQDFVSSLADLPYLDWYARAWLASRCAVNGPEPFHLMLASTASPDKRLWAVPRFDEKPTMHGLIGRIPSGRVLAR